MRLKDPLTLLLLLQTILVVASTQGNETLASCKTRYQYYYNGECYSICPSGSYSSSYTNSACLDCPRPCSECGYNYTSEAVECTSCANGLGMTKSGKCFDTYDVIFRPLIAVAIFLGVLISLKVAMEVFFWTKSRSARRSSSV